jgi:hypothetical protein
MAIEVRSKNSTEYDDDRLLKTIDHLELRRSSHYMSYDKKNGLRVKPRTTKAVCL